MKCLQGVTHIALSLCFPLKFSSYSSNRLVWSTFLCSSAVELFSDRSSKRTLSFFILGHQLFLGPQCMNTAINILFP